MKKMSQAFRILFLTTALGVTASAAEWEVLYRQGFANDTGAFQQSRHYDWSWYYGANAAEGTYAFNRIHYFSGGAPVENVNAPAPFGENIDQGYWVIASTSRQLAFVELSVERAHFERLALGMDQNLGTADPWRFAVRLGEDWHASESTFTNTGGWGRHEVELSADSLWVPIDFVPGGVLQVGGEAVPLNSLEGDLAAAGFCGTPATTAAQRFDNFEVRGVRDPDAFLTFGSWVLLHDLPAGERGLRAMPARDGVANLLKFAFGLEPRLPAGGAPVAPGWAFQEGERYLSVEFPRARNAEGIDLRLEASTDLRGWEEVPGAIEAVGNGEGGIARMRGLDSYPAASFDSRFLRVVVEETTGYEEGAAEPAPDEPLSRGELRRAMLDYFGPGPGEEETVDPDLEIVEKRDMGDHERWHLRYSVHEDDRAAAYLLVPDPPPADGERLPLILAPHPTALIGKDRVVGEYDAPPASDSERAEREARRYAIDLVRRGFLVFAPDRAAFGERRLLDDPEASVTDQMNAYRDFLGERWPGWKLTSGKTVWDLQRALDFLVEMDFVDPDRIASIGHSLGSWDSLMIAAMDDRVKAIVANSGGMVEFRPELWRDNEALRDYLDRTGAQGLRSNVNVFLMLIAPRPVLYNWSLDDPYEQGEPNILEGLRTVHEYYNDRYDGPDPWWKPPFNIYFHGRGHDFPPEARALAYTWLEGQLAR